MVASPARMHTNGSGRRPFFGAVVARMAISTNAAAIRSCMVRITPSRWSVRYRSRSIRRNASVNVAPPIGSSVKSPVTVPSNVVEMRSELGGGGGVPSR